VTAMKIVMKGSLTLPKPPGGTISLLAREHYELDDEMANMLLGCGAAVLASDVGVTIDPKTLEPYPPPPEPEADAQPSADVGEPAKED